MDHSQHWKHSSCSDITVPQLAITKINYHPAISTEFPDSDAMEFLEIRNTGTTTVNLSGVYFTGTGLVYQFPANSTLGPGLCVIIAANAAVFQTRYGFSPSDSSQGTCQTAGRCS